MHTYSCSIFANDRDFNTMRNICLINLEKCVDTVAHSNIVECITVNREKSNHIYCMHILCAQYANYFICIKDPLLLCTLRDQIKWEEGI